MCFESARRQDSKYIARTGRLTNVNVSSDHYTYIGNFWVSIRAENIFSPAIVLPLRQHTLQKHDLLLHGLPSRATGGGPHLHTLLVIEAVQDVVSEARIDGMEIVDAHLIHGDSVLLRKGHTLTGNVVRVSERHAPSHQIICEIGGKHVWAIGLISYCVLSDRGARELTQEQTSSFPDGQLRWKEHPRQSECCHQQF